MAEAGFALKAPASALGFAGMQGDAMRVRVDDQPAGWVWRPDWWLTLSCPLDAGPHRLNVELVPSTYNRFGPHHYFNGDRRLGVAFMSAGGGPRPRSDPAAIPGPSRSLIHPVKAVIKMCSKVGGHVPVPASERGQTCAHPATHRGTSASTLGQVRWIELADGMHAQPQPVQKAGGGRRPAAQLERTRAPGRPSG